MNPQSAIRNPQSNAVLIVDDKPENLYLLETLLKRSGYDVVTAGDGVEALEKLKQDSIDVIISDILMPKMDGFQLCRKCKTDDGLKRLPFIFYTATYTEKKDEEFALSLGAEKFIVKPIDIDEFLKILEAVMEDYKKGALVAPRRPIEEEAVYLAEYNARLVRKLEKKMHDLSIRNMISQILLTVSDEDMYEEVLHVILEIMESKYGVFGYINEDGNLVCPSMTRNIWDKCQVPDKTFVFPQEKWGGIWGRAVTEKKSFYSNKPFSVPEGHIPVTRAIDVPIVHKSKVIGNLLVANKKTDYDEKDVSILETIADHIAPVLDARLQRDMQDKERQKAEEFIRNILESVGEGFCVIDRDYRIIMANKAFGCRYDMQIEEMTGKYCYEICRGADKPCYKTGLECPVKHTFKTGKSYTVIHSHKDKEGIPFYVEIKSYPMKDESGNIVSAIEVTNDITEKRGLEDQLRQAQKMEAVGRLAGGIAHDFNNILTVIMGYSNILKMNMRDDDPLRTDVDQILGSSRRAAELTQGLLAFSRQQIIHPEPVRPNEIVESVKKLLLRLIGEDIEFKTNLADKDLTIMADRGQIEQVLMNLATNARDAMQEGGLLTISTELVELDSHFIKTHGYDVKPGMYSLISVTDTGSGMDESTRKRIFEPFFTTKVLRKGTGLGLSIIYGIVTQHNGFVDVFSKPGKGTTFKIYLPVIKSAIEETEEDDEGVRTMTKTLLDRFGYKVIEAVDGEDAVTRFKENKDKIDLVILDVIMPKKNGKMVYDEIKELCPGIKAIFTSGYSRDIIDKKGIFEEGINFIPKPVLLNELLRKMREVLDEW